jgi:mono/diheme cytochrome c family protein
MARKGDRVTSILPSWGWGQFRSRRGIELLAFSFLAVALAVCASGVRAQSAGQAEKSATTPTGNSETGKKIFTKDGCYECHGREGQGAAQGAGPRIGPPQLALDGFMSYVRQPSGQMPPYTAKVLSDQELADIYAYLQSRPKAKASKDIPLLNE